MYHDVLNMSQQFRTHHPRLGSLSRLVGPMGMWGNAPPPAASLALGVLRVVDGKASDHRGSFVHCTPGFMEPRQYQGWSEATNTGGWMAVDVKEHSK